MGKGKEKGEGKWKGERECEGEKGERGKRNGKGKGMIIVRRHPLFLVLERCTWT